MSAPPMSPLHRFAPDVWLAEGPEVNFLGFRYNTRMAVIRLADERLWLWSPVAPTVALVKAVTELGRPAFIVSPNKLHHFWLGDWQARFPDILMHAPPGLADKRPDLAFDGALGDRPEPGWAGQIDQVVFRGSPAMQEVVFFHKASRTALFGDLIENFPPGWFSPLKQRLARMWGIAEPDGRAPLEWRLSFLFGKKQARRALEKILSWRPERVVIAHGTCYARDGTAQLRRAFRWV